MYPFPADDIPELQSKIYYDQIPEPMIEINKDLINLWKEMLDKDYTKRPNIEEIIYKDEF